MLLIVRKRSTACFLGGWNVAFVEGEALALLDGWTTVYGFAEPLVALINVEVVLDRGADVLHLMQSRPSLCCLIFNYGRKVSFVADQHNHGIWAFGSCDLVPFSGSVDEGFRFGEIKDQHHSLTAIEVRPHHRSVLLLTRSIPDVQFYRLSLDLHLPYLEVNDRHRF